ncbi:MAG: FecR family protein [Syntrophobacterales bacterium]|jgi:hypothetical protein|nr:FecR family protein [Syntrophobacterales bacterium]
MQKLFRFSLIILVLMALAAPLAAHAAVVGRFTEVRGEVNVLKRGQIPGLPVKLYDTVEPGDVIRTKYQAKAQLTMVDDSVITLAPESRLAVADYVYKPSGERRAVVRLFRGLAHTVVRRVIETEEPDFIMETHTAIIGVRGTDWYTLLMPGFTSLYLAHGVLGVSSNNAAIPALLLLRSMQFTQIPMGKQPYLPRPMTPEMLRSLEGLMDTGIIAGALYIGPGPQVAGELPSRLPTSPDQVIQMQTIPPTLIPQPQVPGPGPGGQRQGGAQPTPLTP